LIAKRVLRRPSLLEPIKGFPYMPSEPTPPSEPKKSSIWRSQTFAPSTTIDVVARSVTLGLACLLSYELTVHLLSGVHSVAASDDRLGAMWAVIATVFVYRDTETQSVAAAVSRISATVVSLALCLIYLLIAAPAPWALAFLIALGTTLVRIAGRPGDSVTTGVTVARSVRTLRS
jgi:hypothetical protein